MAVVCIEGNGRTVELDRRDRRRRCIDERGCAVFRAPERDRRFAREGLLAFREIEGDRVLRIADERGTDLGLVSRQGFRSELLRRVHSVLLLRVRACCGEASDGRADRLDAVEVELDTQPRGLRQCDRTIRPYSYRLDQHGVSAFDYET